jgi:hypothetical protein
MTDLQVLLVLVLATLAFAAYLALVERVRG